MTDSLDPRGLIREAYRMDVGKPECRSIFLDWAIGLPDGAAPKAYIQALLKEYAADAPTHPMTEVLTEGLSAPERTGRRGGRAARHEG
ncbi:MAG: hypothetical protein AAFR68_23105 [Pseudomonadota bacterium]